MCACVCVCESVRGEATADWKLWDCEELPDRMQDLQFHFIRGREEQAGYQRGKLISWITCESDPGLNNRTIPPNNALEESFNLLLPTVMTCYITLHVHSLYLSVCIHYLTQAWCAYLATRPLRSPMPAMFFWSRLWTAIVVPEVMESRWAICLPRACSEQRKHICPFYIKGMVFYSQYVNVK